MGTSTVTDYESILQLVRGWPSDKRLSLVRDVLKTLKPQERPHIAWQDDAFEFIFRAFEDDHVESIFREYSGSESVTSGEVLSSAGKVFFVFLNREKAEAPKAATQPRRKRTLDKALGLLATDRPAPSDAEVERWLDEHRTEKYG